MFNIHKAVDQYINNYIPKNKRNNYRQLQMFPLNDQKDENQFLKNSTKNKVLNLNEKSMIKMKKIQLKEMNYVKNQLLKEQMQFLKQQKEEKSANEILQNSRMKVEINRSKKDFQMSVELSRVYKDEKSVDKVRRKEEEMVRMKRKEENVKRIMSDRFLQYKKNIKKNINNLQGLCNERYGGIQHMNKQLSKNALQKQKVMEYYKEFLMEGWSDKETSKDKINSIFHFRKNGQNQETYKFYQNKLPKIKSLSLKNLSLSQKSKSNSNKWYINPAKRFSNLKQQLKFDWKTSDGIKNVIRTKQIIIPRKQIKDLVEDVKKKFNRQPIFCKYVKYP